MGYTKQSILQAQHIYLLSERGYMKVVKLMDNDKSWDVMDSFIDEYFHLRDDKEMNEVATTHTSTNFDKVLRYIEEQEQKRFQMMMDMVENMKNTFESFDRSMISLTNYLTDNTNSKTAVNTPSVPISVKDMIAESKSTYTNYGKKYRAEVIEMCQKIVTNSEFEDEKAVLASCYRHLTKNYGICWQQEIKDWKEKHAYAGKVSVLNVISESDEDHHLRSMLKNILTQILLECEKNDTSKANTLHYKNHSAEQKFKPVTNYIDAYALLQHIAAYKKDNSRYMIATLHSVCVLISRNNDVDWFAYENKYRDKYSIPKSKTVSKIKMIKEFTDLHTMFVQAVNELGRRYFV